MAANETVSLIVKLLADGVQFTKTMDDAKKKAVQTGQDIARGIQDVSGKIAAGATVFGGAITAGFAVAGAGAADFQNDMAGVIALLDEDVRTPAMVKSLTEGARNIRTEFGLTGSEVAEAMRTAVGSGIEAADAVAFLETSAKAAVSGMVPLKDVVGVTAKTVKAFGLEAKDAQRVQDALAKAVNLGTVEWTDFANGLGQVVPFAKQSGMSVEELAGTIADLTLKGFPADQAMTSLKAAMVGILEPQKEASDMFARLGIALRDSEGHARPFLQVLGEVKAKLAEKGVINIVDEKEVTKQTKKLGTIQEKIQKLKDELAGEKDAKKRSIIAAKLEDANKELGTTQQKLKGVMDTVTEKLDKDGTVAALFGDVNAKAVGVALLSDNMDGLNKTLGSMQDSAGAVNTQFEGFTENNAKFDMAKMREEFANTKERIGDAVLTIFLPLAKSFGEVVKAIGDWTAAHPELTKVIVAITGTIGGLSVVVGGLFFVISKLAGAYVTLTGLQTALATGFTAVGASGAAAGTGATVAGTGAAAGSTGFWAMAAAVWAALAPILAIIAVIALVVAALYGLYKLLDWAANTKVGQAFFDWLYSVWEGVYAAWDAAVNWLAGWFERFGQMVSDGVDAVGRFFYDLGSAIKDAIGSAVDWVFNKLTALWDKIKEVGTAAADFLNPFGDSSASPSGGGSIPGYATGGIVTRRTLAYVGEAGPEAIIPLRGGGVPVVLNRSEPAGTGRSGGSGDKGMTVVNHIYQQPGQSMTQLADEVARVTLRRRGLA